MGGLRVKLLGRHTIEVHENTVVESLSGKAQALLAYVMLTRGVHSRAFLASLLWSDQREAQAKKNLRNVLPNLRDQLTEHIVITRQAIEFNTRLPYEVDAELFERIVGGNLKHVALPTLENALSLYDGEFLDGFHVRGARLFEAWLEQQRTYFHKLVVTGWETVANRYLHRDAFLKVEAAAERLLTFEPFHEAGHRLMMQALIGQGRQADALSQYERCVQVLREELDVEVSAETQALYKQIKNGSQSPSKPNVNTEQSTSSQTTLCVNREQELDSLHTRLSFAFENKPQLVLIRGETGSGKSCLLETFIKQVDNNDVEVLSTYGTQLSQSNDTYRIFRNLVRPLGTRWPPNDRSVTDYVVRKIQALSKRHLVLLVFDDLQWADSASWVLFFELVQRLTDERVLILAAYRTDWQTDPQWRLILSELSIQANYTGIDLDKVRRREGQHFIDQLLDRQPNHLSLPFRQRLFALTKGHPRLTTTVLDALKANGALKIDDAGILQLTQLYGWDELEDEVEELLENWLLPLPSKLHRVLSVASVEGGEFTASVIQDALETDMMTLAGQLGVLERRYGLINAGEPLQIGRKQHARYRFRYPLMRRHLYNRLTWLEHSTLAEALGRALHRLYSVDESVV